MSLFENASERLHRINASVQGHEQPERLAGLLGRLQTMEASIAALLGAADLRPAVAVTDPPTEVERNERTAKLRRLRSQYLYGMPSLAFMPAMLHSLLHPRRPHVISQSVPQLGEFII